MQRPIRALKDEGFTVVEILPGPDGCIDTQKFLQEIDKNTVLAACMAVNNETGAVQDIAALGKGIKRVTAAPTSMWTPCRRGCVCRSTCKNGARWTAFRVGPQGPRAQGCGRTLYPGQPAPDPQAPYIGGHQERGLRPGTENTPYIVGLGMAAALGQQKLRTRMTRIAELNARLRAGLAALDGITLNSPADAVGEIVNFSTNCINSQTFINYLNTRAVYVSGGSACDKGEPSHTLLAMGCSDLTVRTALRVSLCADNTAEDVDALLAGVRDGLKELQHI